MSISEVPLCLETAEFDAVLSGKKRFVDVLVCDWKTGDTIRIFECNDQGEYTDRSMTRKVKLRGTGFSPGVNFRTTLVELIE